jgi:hypothetical protein
MSGNVVCVGIDVDDIQYHGSALDRQTGEVLGFQCRPILKGLIGQLDNVRKHFGGVALELFYEASYVGFSLQRDLAECYANGLLSVVAEPDDRGLHGQSEGEPVVAVPTAEEPG